MFNKQFKKEPTEKQKIGQLGEDSACEYLIKMGYKVIERNYLKKWGEIDIVAKKDNRIHFIEVKSVSRIIQEGSVIRETKNIIGSIIMGVVRGGGENKREDVQKYGDESIFPSSKEIHQNNDSYRAEDNMHPWKLQRLGRAVQSYLLERDIQENVDWQFDVVTVHLDMNTGLSEVSILQDIVL